MSYDRVEKIMRFLDGGFECLGPGFWHGRSHTVRAAEQSRRDSGPSPRSEARKRAPRGDRFSGFQQRRTCKRHGGHGERRRLSVTERRSSASRTTRSPRGRWSGCPARPGPPPALVSGPSGKAFRAASPQRPPQPRLVSLAPSSVGCC